MHGHASGLVQRNQVLVFKQHAEISGRHTLRLAGGHGLLFLRHPRRDAHRRQPHQITGLHPGIGFDTAFVDAHLTAANQSVNVGFGDSFKAAHQKIVDALTATVFIYTDRFDPGNFWGGFALYN
ncbi:hypothetical protein GALL_540500 [mine drainage metagenome]|uniref:Uncharacterized protein n=1 Tax=mine drainage metagenome TaxID=410659 RepID=A0A1J5P9B6_9ZZZZ